MMDDSLFTINDSRFRHEAFMTELNEAVIISATRTPVGKFLAL
jgi:hypothetical protein